jgi:hypothetical protein
MSSKPRVVKDYDKLDEEILEQIKLNYPYGFDKHLIQFKNAKGQIVSALPFEAEDRYYLVRMTRAEAQEIIDEDDDYGDDGILKEDVKEEYSDKYIDEEDLAVVDDEDDSGFGDDDEDIDVDDDDDAF